MNFEVIKKAENERKTETTNDQEIKRTALVREPPLWKPFDDKIGKDSKRLLPSPEQIEKMNKIINDLSVLFNGFDKWHLDGALNISLLKKEYIGDHKDVDLSIERRDLKDLESFLNEKNYALFLSQNELDENNNTKKLMRRVSHIGIENYEGHPMICAIKEDGEIDLSKDLNYLDLHVVDRNNDGLPLLNSGVDCPEEWAKSYPIKKEGQIINLSHPAKVLYYKLKQGRDYDATDIDRLLELDLITESDFDDIKSILEKEFIKYKEEAFTLCEEINNNIKPTMTSSEVFKAIKTREEFKDKEEMNQSLKYFAEEITKLKDISADNIFNLAISMFALDKKNQRKINELDKIKQEIVDNNELTKVRDNIAQLRK